MDDSKDKEGASVSPVHSANKWESASFGDGAQKEKFLRLMGGMKKQHTGRFVIGETTGETSKANARTDDENKELVKTLEHQFQIGIEKKLTGQNRRHVGLGFSEPEDEKEQKAEETDEPKGTHTRFDDDGVESETKGKSGDDDEGEAGSRKDGKDGKDSGRKDRERDSDKERKQDESHLSRRDADRRSTDRKRGEKREHHRSHHRSGEDRKHRDDGDGKDRHERREDRGKRRDEEAKTSRRDEDRKHKRDDRGSEDTDDHHKKKRKSSNSD